MILRGYIITLIQLVVSVISFLTSEVNTGVIIIHYAVMFFFMETKSLPVIYLEKYKILSKVSNVPILTVGFVIACSMLVAAFLLSAPEMIVGIALVLIVSVLEHRVEKL